MASKVITSKELSASATSIYEVFCRINAAQAAYQEMTVAFSEEAQPYFLEAFKNGEALTTLKVEVLDEGGQGSGQYVMYQSKTKTAEITTAESALLKGLLPTKTFAKLVVMEENITVIYEQEDLLKHLASIPSLKVTLSAAGDIVIKTAGLNLRSLPGVKVDSVPTVKAGLLDKVVDDVSKMSLEGRMKLMAFLAPRISPTVVAGGTTSKE